MTINGKRGAYSGVMKPSDRSTNVYDVTVRVADGDDVNLIVTAWSSSKVTAEAFAMARRLGVEPREVVKMTLRERVVPNDGGKKTQGRRGRG